MFTRQSARCSFVSLSILFVCLFSTMCLFSRTILAESKAGHGSSAQKKEEKAGHGKEKPEKKKKSAKPASDKASPTKEENTSHGDSKKPDSEKHTKEPEPTTIEKAPEISAIDLVLLVDSSGSMLRTDPLRLRDQGAKLLSRFLKENDRFAIYQFDTDVKKIRGLEAVSPANIPEIDTAIDNISAQGRYTDLQAPIAEAYALLSTQGRKDANKCIVVLSDGKMDPHPQRGTPEGLSRVLFQQDLPKLGRDSIFLYTLSLSGEADTRFLAQMAQETGALHWEAHDLDGVHQRFSDLFLTLKKPQIVPLAEGGFEIDGKVTEATFYISRKSKESIVSISDPLKKRMTAMSAPADVRWYRGDHFDIVTIRNPIPGTWSVDGVRDAEGFATLISDLKLNVEWPQHKIAPSDNILVKARVEESDKPLDIKGLAEVMFFTYKIINAETGEIVRKGSLRDEGSGGDEVSADGFYSYKLEALPSGGYKALIGLTTPTFTRAQHIPFEVGETIIRLEHIAGDESAHKPERFLVELGGDALALKDREVELVALEDKTRDSHLLELSPMKDSAAILEASPENLPPGNYSLKATAKGEDAKKGHVVLESPVLAFEKANTAAEKDLAEHKEEAHDPEADPKIYGLSSIVIALIWAGCAGWFVVRSIGRKRKDEARTSAYDISADVQAQIQKLKEQTSPNLRKATDEERK